MLADNRRNFVGYLRLNRAASFNIQVIEQGVQAGNPNIHHGGSPGFWPGCLHNCSVGSPYKT